MIDLRLWTRLVVTTLYFVISRRCFNREQHRNAPKGVPLDYFSFVKQLFEFQAQPSSKIYIRLFYVPGTRQCTEGRTARAACLCLFLNLHYTALLLWQEGGKLDKWGKTVLEIDTRERSRLPIVDVSAFDVGREGQDFKLEIGPACFHHIKYWKKYILYNLAFSES